MSIDEFESLVSSAGLLNDMLNQRDIGVCFNQAVYTYVDELSQDKHLRAGYLEFVEAFARACERASVAPNTDQIRGHTTSDMEVSTVNGVMVT